MTSTCGLACGSSNSGGGGASGSGTQSVSCNLPNTNQCGIFTVASADISAMKQQCTKEGGTVVDACPSANLDGCCTTGPLKYCYYNGAGTQTQPQCQPGGGTWATTI